VATFLSTSSEDGTICTDVSTPLNEGEPASASSFEQGCDSTNSRMIRTVLAYEPNLYQKEFSPLVDLEAAPDPLLWNLDSGIEFPPSHALKSSFPFHTTAPIYGQSALVSGAFSPSIPTSLSPGSLSRSLALRSLGRDGSHISVMFLTRILGCYPAMMLRPETFPPFLHPTTFSESRDRCIPSEALVNCMSIAQMFVNRTKETKKFLWGTVKMEQERMWLEVSVCGWHFIQTY
jgi:hypothetical protein